MYNRFFTRIFYSLILANFIVFHSAAQCPDIPMGILDGTNGFVTEGKAVNDDLGYDIEGSGDINGDGIDDIIIGAPRVDVGGVEDAGEAYVIFGGNNVSGSPFDISTLDGSNGFVVRGSQEGEKLGTSVSIEGDVNNDGFNDILIGSPHGDGIDSVTIIFGSSSGFNATYSKSDINGTNGIIIESGQADARFGESINYVGDVNDDGIDDIIIAAPRARVNGFNHIGLTYVIFGSSTISNLNVSVLNGSNGFKIEGYYELGSGANLKVDGAGDINNDDIDDILLGLHYYDGGGINNSGIVYVIYGKILGFPAVFRLEDIDGNNGFSIPGTVENERLGFSIASAKDFNNDGIEDIIIGAQGYADTKRMLGRAYIVFGANTFPGTFDLTSLDGNNGLMISSDNEYGEFGTAVDGLSDVNGDGITDVIVSGLGSGVGEQGAAYIVFGANSHPASLQTKDIWNTVGYQVFDDTDRGHSRQDFGHAVSGIGDFNNDGFNDFAIGAPVWNDHYGEHGRAYIFYGNTIDNVDREAPAISCPTEVPDLHVNSTLPNYSFLLRDVSDNCTEPWDLTFSQVPAQGTLFTGDVEVEVTVTDRSGNSNSCSFIVNRKTEKIDISCSLEPFSVGDIDETDGTVLYGEKAMGATGFDVNHVGDINGDGIDDFIVGAKGEDHVFTGPYYLRIHTEGAAYVVFGNSSGFPPNIDLALLDGTDGFIIRNDTYFRQSQEMGYSVSSAGDINGDGIEDIMVSDPGRITRNGSWLGEVFVIYGKSSGFSSVFNISDLDGTNGFTIRGIEGSGFLGRSIDNIGDVNDDGWNDIALITGGYGADPGKCYIIYGNNSGFPALLTTDQLDGSNGMTIMGGDTEDLNYISHSVAGLGDINGDGIDDIAISGKQREGNKYVVYGSSTLPAILTVTDLDGSNGFSINHSNENAGFKVNRAGDINGDGFNDVLIGQQYVLFGGSGLSDEIDLANLNGTNGFTLIANNTLESPDFLNHGGDFNNDGTDDLIFITEGSIGSNQIAYVIYGKSTWEDSLFTASMTFKDALRIEMNMFGLIYSTASASYAGDVNNDGIDDVVLGISPRRVNNFVINSHPGYAYVIYGRVITDTDAPDITCPATQTLSSGEDLPDYTDLAIVSDECASVENITVSQDPIPGSDFTPGMTVTLTATDISGNSTSCTFKVNSEADTEAPDITCPGDQSLACDATSLPDYTSLATVNDNEDPSPTVTQSPVSGSAFTEGMTVTLTARDASGNENSCTFTVNESADTEDPDISCPGDQQLASGTTLPDYTSLASATDNCDSDPELTQSPAAGSAFTDGMTVTLTASDESGNTNTCTFTINQSADTEAPTITCPGDQELVCDATSLPDYTSLATVNDNEDPSPTVTQSPSVGATFTAGMTVTLTATDASGNENTCTFTVNESADTEDPDISCPGYQELASGSTLPDYTSLANATDNCDSDPELTQSPAAGSAFTDGMTVTLTATDENGNTNTCTFTINQVADTEAPTITCPGDQELACGATSLPDYTSLATVNDNEDPSPTVTQSPVSGSAFTEGMTVTLTARDASGNENSCTFTVNESADTEDPDISCPGDQELASGSTLPDYTSLASATDNCDSDPELTQSPAAGSAFTDGMTVTLTATDESGNTNTCTFTINQMADTEAPTITCPGDQELACGATSLPDYTTLATVNDNEDPSPTVTQSPSVGATFTAGMTVTLTATDASGNENTCTFTVKIGSDSEAPSLNCPGNQFVECGITELPDFTDLAVVTDKCDDNVSITQSPSAGTNLVDGMLVTIEAIDQSGNSSSCSFTVSKREDQTAPEINCLDDQILLCGSTLPDFTDRIDFNDNCDAAVVLSQLPAPGSLVIEESEITITARDASGNESTCTFLVQIEADFTVDAGFDEQMISGDTILLEAYSTSTGVFTWSPQDHLLGLTNENPVMASLSESTTFTVELRREDGCTAYDEVRVEVIEREGFKDKYGFSPDGDGINETLRIVALDDYPENKVLIYNKWGQLVFETVNYGNGVNTFDGNANQLTEWGAGELPEGTYYFLIQFPDGSHESVKGFIVLKR